MTPGSGARRWVVVGCSGSGKSTLAAEMAEALGVAHVELDALFHRPGWTPAPAPEFQAELTAALDEADAAVNGWLVCGNYMNRSGGVHVGRAEGLVWLDLPRRVVMARVVRRTLIRTVLRKPLWNGNRERLGNLYRWDPEHNIIRWAWTTHGRYRRDFGAAVSDGSWQHLDVHRLGSAGEVDAFLADFRSRGAGPRP